MADFVTSPHAAFGRKLAKLRGSVKDAFSNETTMKNTDWPKATSSTRLYYYT